MSDRAIVSAQIRFALEQLSQRNAQHEFEHLCRYLALQRICANILPATGPVQAGGDQGRDFETFRSYLASNGLRDSSSVGLIAGGMIAFACTLNKEYRPKIQGDVATIIKSGSRVEAIHYFCAPDVPVAQRHELQTWARQKHQVELEIYDGAGISELLSSYDVFWIAERYLLLPSHLAPAPPTEEDWYAKLLNKWQHAPQPARKFADFVEVRAAARHALGEMRVGSEGWQHGYEKTELPFWVSRLEEIAAQAALQHLQRKADYEVLVLRLRGLGSWKGHESRVRGYFNFISQLQDAADFADAVTMLSYAMSARRSEWCDLTEAELEAWRAQLCERMDERREEVEVAGDHPNDRADLLETRGHLELCPPSNDKWPEIESAIKNALRFWNQMVDVVKEAPLYPIEQFCSRLTAFTKFLSPFEGFQSLCDRADTVLEKRSGTSKIAEQHLERAIVLREAGRLPDAMHQLHRVRADWYNGETLPKCLMVMLWLAHAYEVQGLCFAARFYGLATAHMALHAPFDEVKQILPKALLLVADTDYAQGAYHSALEATELAHLLYAQFAHQTEKEEQNPHSDINRNLFHLSQMRLVTERLHPEMLPWLEDEVKRIATPLDLADVIDVVMETCRKTWPEGSDIELRAKIEEQTVTPPWSDSGLQRRASWKAHGINWSAQWENDFEVNGAVEEFLATLQLYLSELATRDLCLLRSSLNLTFELHDDVSVGSFGYDAHFLPSNAERICCVRLPRRSESSSDNPEVPTQIKILGVVLYLLQEVSLLPHDELLKKVEDSFREGLSGKLLAGLTYHEVHSSFFDLNSWTNSSRQQHVALNWPGTDNFGAGMKELIPWVKAFLPDQSKQDRLKAVKERYENTLKIIPITLTYLRRQSSFRQTVKSLRSQGWKDWHLLLAVFNVTASYRLAEAQLEIESATGSALRPSQINEIAQMLQQEPETADMPIPPATEFSEEHLRTSLRLSMLSTVRVVGLEINQMTPDFEAIEDFLSQRHRYWEDDVPHSDPFAL